MNARKILQWAATGWTPMLIFIASVVVLYATLHSHFMWMQLTGLLLCGSSGIFLAQTMPGGRVWRDMHLPPSDARKNTATTASAKTDDQECK